MRLGPDHVAQLIESDPPRVVIVQDHDQQEVLLDAERVRALLRAIGYFAPTLGISDGEMVEDLLITRAKRTP